MELERFLRLFPKWRGFAIGAIVFIAATFFVALRFSAEGRFRSFAEDFHERYAERLAPAVREVMHNHQSITASSQFHTIFWNASKDRFGDDNSWGTYTHTILFSHRDDLSRFLIVSAEMNFQRIPKGMALPSGRSKGWARFGEVHVEATLKHVVGGEEKRSRTAIPHGAFSRAALARLADQVADSM